MHRPGSRPQPRRLLPCGSPARRFAVAPGTPVGADPLAPATDAAHQRPGPAAGGRSRPLDPPHRIERSRPPSSTAGRVGGMSKPTSIKTSEEVRDRLRVLAEERGTTITELLEELASREPTEAERKQRAAEAARELGIPYTEQVQQAGQDAWAKIRAHQGGAAA
ncbi:ribbon-helix-helix protein [Streptomyces prasinus]